MKIAIIGPGRIGGNLARCFAQREHEVTIAFSRDEAALKALAQHIGHGTQAATPAEAVQRADVVVLSVPWVAIDTAIKQMGDLNGKVIIDTTNPFAGGPVNLSGLTSLAYNRRRLPNARVAKAFNTITAEYQAEVASGQHHPIAMFYAAPDSETQKICAELITAMGFEPIGLEGPGEALLEAPRRKGAVYGESYLPEDAKKIADIAQQDLAEAARLADERKQK